MSTCSYRQGENSQIRDRPSSMSWMSSRWSHTLKMFNITCNPFITGITLPCQLENLLDCRPRKTTQVASWSPSHLQKLLSSLKEVLNRDIKAFLDVLVVKFPCTFFRLPARVTHWKEKKSVLNPLDLLAAHPFLFVFSVFSKPVSQSVTVTRLWFWF